MSHQVRVRFNVSWSPATPLKITDCRRKPFQCKTNLIFCKSQFYDQIKFQLLKKTFLISCEAWFRSFYTLLSSGWSANLFFFRLRYFFERVAVHLLNIWTLTTESGLVVCLQLQELPSCLLSSYYHFFTYVLKWDWCLKHAMDQREQRYLNCLVVSCNNSFLSLSWPVVNLES